MALTGIGQNNNQNYIQESGKNTGNTKAANRNKAGRNTDAESTDFSIKYVQAGGGNKVYLDPEAIFSNYHAQSGESVNVYRAEDFSEENPIYIVKGTDRNGNEYEEKIDVSKVNPNLCSYKEMLALGIHTGKKSDDLFFSMSILKDKTANVSYSEKADYLSMLSELRSDMKTLGHWDGYLRYDKIIADILRYCKDRKTQNSNEAEKSKEYVKSNEYVKTNEVVNSAKSENDKKSEDTEESKTDSEVIVKPDGSKVLMMTTHVGGMETVMSLQISEPSALQGESAASAATLSVSPNQPIK